MSKLVCFLFSFVCLATAMTLLFARDGVAHTLAAIILFVLAGLALFILVALHLKLSERSESDTPGSDTSESDTPPENNGWPRIYDR